MNREKLKDKRLFLLDMDGTIYLDNYLFDGTLDFLNYVKSIGGRYMFLTNNSSKSVDKYIQKLSGMGITACKDDFFTSADASCIYLKDKKYKKIYVFGTQSLKSQLSLFGLNITDTLSDDIDCLLAGFDTELTFSKLEDACILLGRQNVDFVATNPDWVCPTSYGFVPDCGSVCQMLYNATKRRPLFIGKPKPEMINLAIAKTPFSKEETIIFGDRLYTDIASGINAGIDTAFVLSGEGKREDIEKEKIYPAYVFENIREIYKTLTE